MLYNEYRPKTLNNLVGQEVIVQTLGKKLADGEVPHSMLFIGVRGTGKTTTARIVAKSLNCESPNKGEPCCCCENCRAIDRESSFDVQEMDAAANRGVEDMNRLLDSINTVPIMKKKVYIIDEVHMLTKEASNRLLKVLEEPPANVHFILCTTELLKVLPTIRSRCSMFNFKGIDEVTIATELSHICEKKSIDYDLEALYIVAKAAKSSMRDALSLMEPLISDGGKITCELTYDMLGVMDDSVVLDLLTSVFQKDVAKVQDTLENMIATGRGMDLILESLLTLLNDLLLIQLSGNAESITNTTDYKEKATALATLVDEAEVMELFDEIKKVRSAMLKDGNAKLSLLCAFLSHIYREKNNDEVAKLRSELALLKKKVDELISHSYIENNIASIQTENNGVCENTGSDIHKIEEVDVNDMDEEDMDSYEDVPEDIYSGFSTYQDVAEVQESSPVSPQFKSVANNNDKGSAALSGYCNMMKGFLKTSKTETADGFEKIENVEDSPFEKNIKPEQGVESAMEIPEDMLQVFKNSGLKTGTTVIVSRNSEENECRAVKENEVITERKEQIQRNNAVATECNSEPEKLRNETNEPQKDETTADVVSIGNMASFLSGFSFFGK